MIHNTGKGTHIGTEVMIRLRTGKLGSTPSLCMDILSVGTDYISIQQRR